MSGAQTRRRPPLVHGVGVALALSLAGGALFVALGTVLAGGTLLRLLIVLLGGAYLLYLLGSSGQRIGRVATVAIWTLASVVLWVAAPPLSLYLLIHVAMLWLIRSLYFYSGVFPVLIDLGLNVLALAFSFWALSRSGSAFLALWCFFLAQALFVLIPATVRGRKPDAAYPPAENEAFVRAHRAAEAALRRLATPR